MLHFISLFTPPSCWWRPICSAVGQHVHPRTHSWYPLLSFFFFPPPSRCFHLTIGFYSALHPHQRSSCSSPQPTGMFDIPSFKPHQERGHLKTWACVIIFGVPRHPHSEGRKGRGYGGFEFIMSYYFHFLKHYYFICLLGFLCRCVPSCFWDRAAWRRCTLSKVHRSLSSSGV